MNVYENVPVEAHRTCPNKRSDRDDLHMRASVSKTALADGASFVRAAKRWNGPESTT